MRQRGPNFLAVDDVMIAILHRPRLQAGKVGAGARLGIALTEHPLAGEDFRQVLVFLRLRAESHQHRPAHIQAKAGKPRRTGEPRLLIEDITMHGVPFAAAILFRPVRCDPALFVEDFMPTHIVVFLDLHARQMLFGNILWQVLVDESTDFLAEFFFFRAENHGAFLYRCGRDHCAA